MKICFRQGRVAALTALVLCALGGTFLAGAAGAASLWDDRTLRNISHDSRENHDEGYQSPGRANNGFSQYGTQ